MKARWLMILIALWSGTVSGNGCSKDFFPATSDTCLHVGFPSMASMDDYCKSLRSRLYGRPLSDEMAESLAERMFYIAQHWMPQEAYLGMIRARDMYERLTEDWRFLGERDAFSADSYDWWHKKPKPKYVCTASIVKHEFKVLEYNCSEDIGSICQKPDKPCYLQNVPYVDYHGVCAYAISDKKRFDAAERSCEQGRLMELTSESHYQSVIEAMYNTRFAGGIYIGLNKSRDGVWKYNNGDEESGRWESDDDNSFACGGVRLMFDKRLGYYSLPCDKARLSYLCETGRSS